MIFTNALKFVAKLTVRSKKVRSCGLSIYYINCCYMNDNRGGEDDGVGI